MLEAIELYTMVITSSLPYALVFAIGDLIIGHLFTAAFSGRFVLK